MLEPKTLSEIKALHLGHFFDRDAMRFFNSKIYPNVYAGAEHWFFVTSERFDDNTPRLYTVRSIDRAGDIRTVGEFQEYPTLDAARAAARQLAKNEGGI